MIRMLGTAPPPLQVFWLHDTLWSMPPALRPELLDQRGLRLGQWIDEGFATLVKTGAGRTIHRVRLQGLDLYVKHFRAVGLPSLLHQALRQGRAEKEFQLAHFLQQRGVPTIRPLALGERWTAGLLRESYLVTEAIPDSVTLFEIIERHWLTGCSPCTPRVRRRLAEELAELAAAIHELGVEHRDLHERNVVAQPTHGGGYRLHLLDLHEVRLHPSLPWERALRELARMGRYFTLRSTRADRFRFFRRYVAARGMDPLRLPLLARNAETATIESRAEFWRRRDVRSLHKNPRATAYRSWTATALAAEGLPESVVRDLMARPKEPFQHVVRWWKQGRATRVAEVALPAIRSGEPLVYKQYRFKGVHESLAALLRENQATRAWRHGCGLMLRELPTPRPLLLIHRRIAGVPISSYLVTERVPDGRPISKYLDDFLPPLERPERQRVLRGVVAEAAALLRKMHDRRVTHRDLKASNLLAAPTGDPARPSLWLIDLDGVQTWQTVPEAHRVQNLARLHVSFHQSHWLTRTERLRFLRLYLGDDFADRERWKRLWRGIWAETERKIRRNLRKGRLVK